MLRILRERSLIFSRSPGSFLIAPAVLVNFLQGCASLPSPQLYVGEGSQFWPRTSGLPEAFSLSPHGNECQGLQVSKASSFLVSSGHTLLLSCGRGSADDF